MKYLVLTLVFSFLFSSLGYANPENIESLLKSKKYDRVIEQSLQMLAEDFKDAQAYYFLGRGYYGRGFYLSASRVFTKSLVLNSQLSEAKLYLARSNEKRREYKRAAAAYRQFLDLQPQHARAHFELGRVYVHLGDLKRAKKQHKILKKKESEWALYLWGLIDPSSVR